MLDALLAIARDPAVGNGAMIFFAVALWRLDRRIVRVETLLKVTADAN